MKRIILGIVGAALAAAFVIVFEYGPPAYRQFTEVRGLRQAKRFLAAGDLANASLSARQVLQLNPGNLGACRIMAELAEGARSPAVIDWRHRIAELDPSVSTKLKLASCALRFQGPPYFLAEQTLADVEAAAQGLPAFHVISAELALKSNQASDADAHFEKAAKLEPNNELHGLNLAVLRLQSTNEAIVSAARATLERLSTNLNLGPLALRWLVAESLRRNDLPAASGFSRRLLTNPLAVLDDQLQQLTILQLSANPGLTGALTAAQSVATSNAVAIYATAEWMTRHGLADEAVTWLAGLDPKQGPEQPVRLALANCYLAQKDWARLESFLAAQDWTDLEFLRYAYRARSAWGQEQSTAGETRWRIAMRAAASRLGPLSVLLGLAGDWGRDQEQEALLWQIGSGFPRERWALRELERLYLGAGNTPGLNKVYAALTTRPSGLEDRRVQNNFAATSMLLKANLPQAYSMAREIYTSHPEDPIIVSTYAYSLHLQGRTGEGLAVFRQLEAERLKAPPIALYYGLLLSAAGDTCQASPYLALAEGANLLPEEKVLLEESKAEGLKH